MRVLLTNEAFEKAVQRYIDDNKPDPIQTKQLSGWTLTWQEQDETPPDDVSFQPTHAVTGRLVIEGEYCEVIFISECFWRGDEQNGSLFFRCLASARLRTTTKAAKCDKCREEKKAADKARAKMIERLQKDDYVSKLLHRDEPLELCQATVLLNKDDPEAQLQERVWCSETTAEAIRRGIFSTADAPIDVFDILCSFPILPTSTFHRTTLAETTVLADRAKLRLLEDALYDACENEGEEELVDELQIDCKRTKR